MFTLSEKKQVLFFFFTSSVYPPSFLLIDCDACRRTWNLLCQKFWDNIVVTLNITPLYWFYIPNSPIYRHLPSMPFIIPIFQQWIDHRVFSHYHPLHSITIGCFLFPSSCWLASSQHLIRTLHVCYSFESN